MKRLLACIITVGLVTSSQAQYNRAGWNGALLGGLAGGLIAGGHHTGEGIAIGAASGLILGSLYTAAWNDGGRYRYYSGYRGYSYSTPNYYFYSPYSTGAENPHPVAAPVSTPQQQQPRPYNAPTSGNMEGANALFGR